MLSVSSSTRSRPRRSPTSTLRNWLHSNLAESELVQRRDGLARQACVAQQADHFANAFGGCRGHGNDGFLNLQLLADLDQPLRGSQHGDVMHARIPFVPVVIKEGHRLKAGPGLERQFMSEQGAGIAGPENRHAPLPLTLSCTRDAEGFTQGAHGESDAGQADQGEYEINGDHPARRRDTDAPNHPHDSRHDRADGQRVEHAGQIRRAEIPEQGTELVEKTQENQLQWDQPHQNDDAFLLGRGLHHEIEAEFIGHPEAGSQLNGVQQEQQPDPDRRRVVEEIQFHNNNSA